MVLVHFLQASAAMTVTQTYSALNRCELEHRKPTPAEREAMQVDVERLRLLIERYEKALK